MTDLASSPLSTDQAPTTYRKKLIEVALPLEAINRESAREKSIRHGHPSTLHLWWARRPLAACRAVLFSQLVDDPSACPEEFPTEEAQEAERQRLFRIIEELVRWENSNNQTVLNAARREIARSVARTAGVPAPETPDQVWQVLREHAPPVLDPFCGGGSIPLEAQRLGLEAHASDLNPVAVLITKALIEIPPKFAGLPPVNPESRHRLVETEWTGARGLAEDVRYYGKWMRDEAWKRIGHLYPKVKLPPEHGGGEATVIAWLWARTVTCPNPACGARMPLVRSFALSTKKGKETCVEPVVDREKKTVRFEVRSGKGTVPEGTVNRRGATCLTCAIPVPLEYVRSESRAGRMSQQLLATVAEGSRGRVYVAPDDLQSAVPQQANPEFKPEGAIADNPGHTNVYRYGLTTWGDLFTPRQLVALTTFSDLVSEARERVGAPHPPAPSPSRGERESFGGVSVGESVGEMDDGDRGDGEGDGELGRLGVPGALQGRMIEVAREFRKEPTASEERVWGLVRGRRLGPRFRRQQPIGPFVVDFFCPEHRLIVEVDGPIHDSQQDHDRERQDLLEACGYRVLRLSATEVDHAPHTALDRIRSALTDTPTSTAPTSTAPATPTPARTTTPLSPGGRGAGGEGAYADAVATYLAFAVDKVAEGSTSLCTWSPLPTKLHVVSTFGRQALPMVWDYAEANPFANSSGNLERMAGLVAEVVGRQGVVSATVASVEQRDATVSVPVTTQVAGSTDPPYYDNIGYSDLSDFFYVWLRRSLGRLYPALFRTLLTPKSGELIASPYRFGGVEARAKEFFVTGLGQAFRNLRSVAEEHYPLSFFYAFKQVETGDTNIPGAASTGWETMLTGLLEAGFEVTGTWPMRTERAGGFRNKDQNALASSIVLVCRPRPSTATLATRREFINALRQELPKALTALQHGNVAPVDLAQASIGPGMAIFSRYAKVLEADGSAMSVRAALGIINGELDAYLAAQEGEMDPDTRFCVAWFEQYGANTGKFGEADVLARAKNTSVDRLRQAGVLQARGGEVRLLDRSELDPAWDPRTDTRVTDWECAQHLILALDREGEEGAARLARAMGDEKAEVARDLAYRLYAICERRGWAEEALAYNSLAASWAAIQERAAGIGTEQGRLI